MKLNTLAFANAAAIVEGLAHLLLAVIESTRPGTIAFLMSSWVQGVRFDQARNSVWSGFLFGWITEIAVTWIFIYILVSLYNEFVKKK